MDKLKLCPFCGGVARLVTYHNQECTWVRYYVKCFRCLTATTNFKKPEYAKDMWNRRADAKPAEIDFDYAAED